MAKMKRSPVDLSEDDVRLAAQGRSEEVVGRLTEKSGPVELDEAEVKRASEGRSEEVVASKRPKGSS